MPATDMSERIYLDHAATAPVLPEVRRALAGVLEEGWGNPSSAHGEGRRSRAALEEARGEVAAFLGCRPAEVVFTSGGTESNSLAIGGVLAASPDAKAPLVIGCVEHPSVGDLAERLAATTGRRVIRLPVSREGILDLGALDRALTARPRPALVSVMTANNETGTLFPVTKIASRCQEAGVPFHSDAVQAAGKREGLLADCGADLISISGHKLGAAQGSGAVMVRQGTPCHPVLGAGAQERGLRGGTENLPGIVGLGAAARLWREKGGELRQKMERLGVALSGWLVSLGGTAINAARGPRLASTLSVRFEGLSGEALLQALDLEGVAVSLGAACASGSLEPSAILQAMGYSRAEAASSVRFSLGWNTSDDDLAALGEILPPLLGRLGRAAAGRRARLGAQAG